MDFGPLFSTAFIVGLSGAMMPGPMLTVTISEVSKQGFWAGPRIVFGHAVIEMLLVGSLVLGLSRFIQQPMVTGTIGLLGGVMLAWMGWGICRDALRLKVEFTAGQRPVSGQRRFGPVLAGMVTSVFNPYWSLWWATVGAGYVVIAMVKGVVGVAVFFAGHILSDLAWYSLVSLGVFRGRSLISDSVYQGILVLCGIFLIGLGGYFLHDGFKILSLWP
ncbi:MAG: LysE family transporter [Negativicutes bacterium]|nr:LysE family transporter [Negativicutes bacterium]